MFQAGEWRYRGEFGRDGSQPVIMSVRSHPESEKDTAMLSLKAWTSWDATHTQGDPAKDPLIIYAEVKKSGRSVVDVRAFAIIEWVDEFGLTSYTLQLHDDGATGK